MLLPRRSEKIDLLKKVPLFSNLGRRHLNEIARHASQVRMKAGAALARQGEKGSDFYIILEGEAKVEKDGKVIRHLFAEDFFGEISLIDGEPRTATVIAETDGALLAVNSKSFNHLLHTIPGLPEKIMVSLFKYLRRAESAINS